MPCSASVRRMAGRTGDGLEASQGLLRHLLGSAGRQSECHEDRAEVGDDTRIDQELPGTVHPRRAKAQHLTVQ